MVYVFSVVGASNSGKTWLIEHIIPELINRGFKVGSIKHTPKGFSFNNEKDSGRHFLAGSELVIFGNKDNSGMISRVPIDEKNLSRILFLFNLFDIDIIVGEGFKQSRIPKIVTLRKNYRIDINAIRGPILCFVSDQEEKIDGKPVLKFNQIKEIVDLVLKHYETVYVKQIKEFDTQLIINGTEIPLNPYIKTVLGSVVTAIIKTLKGVPEPQTVSLYFKLQKGKEV
ncbi:MAG: molybdopterin-guanine dinucleotide biosynthesis protein B [Candidatus Asgardarchaeia archaeon]